MVRDRLSLHSSPFLFLKRLVFIQMFFAFLPFLAVFVLSLFVGDVTTIYERLMPVRGLSYELFVTLIVTILQVLVIFIVFITWYVPRYEVDPEKIIYYRGDMLAERVLANTTSISNMRIKTGWLGNATGYGSIIIETSDTADRVRLTDIPDPQRAVAHLWELVRPDAQVEGEVPNLTTNEVVTGAENQFVEFKSSFQWDYRQQRVNKELHLPVIKNLAAFMNAQGGYVIIGVDDDGNLLGLSADLSSISKKNSDGFENMFNQSFNKMIGVEFRQYVDVTFPEIDGKQICILRVRPSEYPIFVNAKGKETFYIRAGNASQPLSISQAARYISRRFEEV